MSESEFDSPRANLYVSSAGFSVEVVTRNWPAVAVLYREGDLSMSVDGEVLAPPRTMALFPGSMQGWDHPNDAVPVTADDRERIVANIRRAFDWHGSYLQVIEPHQPEPPESG